MEDYQIILLIIAELILFILIGRKIKRKFKKKNWWLVEKINPDNSKHYVWRNKKTLEEISYAK